MLPNFDEKLDPRVKRTRGLILQSFSSLLAQKNFDTITVQDITSLAEINRATFYAHFEDKYALLEFFIRQQFMQEIEKRLLNGCHYTPDNLRALLLTVCEFLSHLKTGCAQTQRQFEPLVEKQVKAQVYELLTVWLRKMDVRTSIEIPVTVATWAIYGLASYWNNTKQRPPLDSFVNEALPLVSVNLEQFAQPI